MASIVAAPFYCKAARFSARAALAAALATALGGCAWLDMQQRRVALRPTPSTEVDAVVRASAARPGDEYYLMPLPGNSAAPHELALWWLPHADPAAPTLLYLHGTFRNLTGNLSKIGALREAGFSVLAVDYRGWGDSTPIVPSEASINADAQLAWDELVRRQPDPRRRVIYGHSMGGAAAVSLASRLRVDSDYGGLVLEATFTRMPDIAASAGALGRFAASWTSLDFNSQSRIGRVDAPLLVMHGSADRVVPIDLGRRLHGAAPAGAQWVEITGGSHSRLHSDAPELYQRSLRDLVARLPSTSP